MTNLSDLPTISAIYHVRYQERVVYVGQAKNLKQRWKNHHIFPKLYERYGNHWRIEWTKVSKQNLDRAEAYAHREFKPELNIQNPSKKLGNAI